MGRGPDRPIFLRHSPGLASRAGGALIEGFSPEIPLVVTTRTVLATGSGRTRLCEILSSAESSGPLSYLHLVARTT